MRPTPISAMHPPGPSSLLAWLMFNAALELQDGARHLVAETWFALMVNHRFCASSPAEARAASRHSCGSGAVVCSMGMCVMFSRTPGTEASQEGWFAGVSGGVVVGGTVIGRCCWVGGVRGVAATSAAEHVGLSERSSAGDLLLC